MGALSSDQSELHLGHGLVSKFQHKLHDDQRHKCRGDSNEVYYIVRTINKIKIITVGPVYLW